MLVDLEREKFKREMAEIINGYFDELTTTAAFLLDIMNKRDYGRVRLLVLRGNVGERKWK